MAPLIRELDFSALAQPALLRVEGLKGIPQPLAFCICKEVGLVAQGQPYEEGWVAAAGHQKLYAWKPASVRPEVGEEVRGHLCRPPVLPPSSIGPPSTVNSHSLSTPTLLLHYISFLLKMELGRGDRVAQLVQCQTLGFSSCHDLMFVHFHLFHPHWAPRSAWCLLAIFSLSTPQLTCLCMHTHCLPNK